MSAADVVLLGYYGRGNFGDDVLMVVAHGISGKILPGARIAVRVAHESTYVRRLLEPRVETIDFRARSEHRLIVHGGGGTFFDFDHHSGMAQFANALLMAAGPRAFIRCDSALRRVTGRQRLSGRSRIGLGVGIGTFSVGSSRLRTALPILDDFDALWLRDAESKFNIENLGVDPPIVMGSDLAFLWEYWCPSELALAPGQPRAARPRVGVILRDWPAGSGSAFAAAMLPLLDQMSKLYDLTFFQFDIAGDAGVREALANYPTVIWDPNKCSIAEFAAHLAGQDVLLTTRAHGAICGACLGRASVILNIEPKMRAINAMLPNATRLIPLDAGVDSVSESIQAALGITLSEIANDVGQNRTESNAALAEVLRSVVL